MTNEEKLSQEEIQAVLNSFHGRNMGKKQPSEGRALLDRAIDFLAKRETCTGIHCVDSEKVYKVIGDWKRSTVKFWSQKMPVANAIKQADAFLVREYENAVKAQESAGINQWLTRDEMGAVEYGDFEAMFGSRIHEVECTGPEYMGEDAGPDGTGVTQLPGGVYTEVEFDMQDDEVVEAHEDGELHEFDVSNWKDKQDKFAEIMACLKNAEFQERGKVLSRAYNLAKVVKADGSDVAKEDEYRLQQLSWKQYHLVKLYAEKVLPQLERQAA